MTPEMPGLLLQDLDLPGIGQCNLRATVETLHDAPQTDFMPGQILDCRLVAAKCVVIVRSDGGRKAVTVIRAEIEEDPPIMCGDSNGQTLDKLKAACRRGKGGGLPDDEFRRRP